MSAVARHWVPRSQKRVDVAHLLPVVSEAESKFELRGQNILIDLSATGIFFFFPF